MTLWTLRLRAYFTRMTIGMVIRAHSVERAREIAFERTGNKAWLDNERSIGQELRVGGEEGIIIEDEFFG